MGVMEDVLKKKGRTLAKQGAGNTSAAPSAGRPASAGGRPATNDRARDAKRPDNERLVSLFAPSGPQGKRIDILRSQLLYPFHGDPPRTIMITSSVPREGRSLLAANLAISFARGMQQFVMVMDCHLTSPTIHNLLGVKSTPGLTDYLEKGAAVSDIIHWTKVDKLSVIPCGSGSERASEILATDMMADLLLELRERYKDRYIILDAPPVQAFDDPAVLARMVEGILFVVQGGVTDREVVLRGLQALPEEKVIGVVLNDMNGAVIDAANISNESSDKASM